MAGSLRRDCLRGIDQLLVVLHQRQSLTLGAWEEVDGIISRLRLVVYHAGSDRCGDLPLP